MKVGVVNNYEVKDIKYWSGIPYHISIMLEAIIGKSNIVYIAVPLKRGLISYLRGFYFNRIIHKNYLSWTDKSVLAKNKKAFDEVKGAGFDLIITFQSFLIPSLQNKRSKIILWSDATFHNLLNFYSYVSNLSQYTLNSGHLLQKNALQISDTVIFSSQWAINSAVQLYSANPEKFFLVPFASNLSAVPSLNDVNDIINKRRGDAIKLLFLGVDWERKGGDMAVSVIDKLNKNGIKSVLYVVGTEIPIKYKDNEQILALGFINKNEGDGEIKIIELLKESSFLILPTKADCTPVVISEANSYGLPVISTNVGGIASVVINNLNGACYEQDNFVEEATLFIEKNWLSDDAYKNLCLNSYNYYNKALSWEIVAEKFKTILAKLKLDQEQDVLQA